LGGIILDDLGADDPVASRPEPVDESRINEMLGAGATPKASSGSIVRDK
jgi:hypothetical protein